MKGWECLLEYTTNTVWLFFLFVHVQSNETLMAQNQKASCSKVSPISSIYTPIWQSPLSLQ